MSEPLRLDADKLREEVEKALPKDRCGAVVVVLHVQFGKVKHIEVSPGKRAWTAVSG